MNIKSGAGLDLTLFKNPPSDCEPSYSWLWNVPVSREVIDRELPEIAKAGVKSLYILPMPKDFRPELTRTYLEPDYLTDEFIDLARYAIRRMIELGIKPWLYDEGGWPSGSACGNTLAQYPDGYMTLLQKRDITLKKGDKYTPCKDFLVLFNGKGRLKDDFRATEDVTLTEYYTAKNTEFDDVYRGFIDFTDPKVTDTFIGNTYEMYRNIVGEHFGDTIPLIFTDEPGLKQGSLPKGCFEEFKAKYGYDFKDYLYVLPDGGAMAVTEEEINARIDFIEYVGERFTNATFKKLRRWCDEAGICYAGHLMADNVPNSYKSGYFSQLDVLRQMAIPGIDAIWEHIRYPYGERVPYDAVETCKMPFFPRLAPSAARQSGNNIALTEAMGIYGDSITPDEIRYCTNYQVIRGINYVSYAHIPVGNQRFSALATRPDYRREKPGFYNLRHINEYYARLTYLARLGYSEIDTALYHPTRDYPANPEICEAASVSYKELGMELERKNIPFDIIDDYGLRHAEICHDGLKIGCAVYKHIAVPANRYMPEDVKKKIAPYVSYGAPVYNFKNEMLRVMTRKLDTGRLWFIFNEGEPTVTEKLNIAGGKKVYRLDIYSAEVYRDDEPTLILQCGDIAVYYVTDEELATVSHEIEYTVEAGEAVPFAHKRFVIDYYKLKNEYGDGNIEADENFSGEISYRIGYELKETPTVGERYKIQFEGFSLTCSLKIGEQVYTLGMTPMTVTVDGSELSRRGEMEITVANTSVNEIQEKAYLKSRYPAAELSPYISRIEVFEKRIPLRVGKVYISKMK